MTTATITKEATATTGTASSVVTDAYSALINLEGEQKFIRLCVQRLIKNTSSVRDIQASIKKTNGDAPTIRASHVQYFVTMDNILNNTEGAKLVSIAELLKMAQRVQTSAGKGGVDEVIEKAQTYAQLSAETPTLAVTRERKNATTPKAPNSVETIFTKTLSDLRVLKGQGSWETIKTTDLQTLASLAELLRVIAKNSATIKA